jgi:hypothetical protein
MPFTLAHPAAAIPLARPLGRAGVLPALVIGSMIPDFAYFRPFLSVGSRSHTLGGLFLFCLPVGAVVFVLFRFLLARPMLALLPEEVRFRVRWGRVIPAAMVVSLLVGAVTHIAWDSFTHDGSPMVRAIPLLQRELFTIDGYTVHLYRLLQHLSTVIGVTLILTWLVGWYRRTPPEVEAVPMSGNLRLLATCAILLGAAVSGIRGGLGEIDGPGIVMGIRAFAGGAVIAGFSTFAVLVTAYAVAWHLGPRRLTGR